jgi:hypothetical protein
VSPNHYIKAVFMDIYAWIFMDIMDMYDIYGYLWIFMA